MNTFSRKLIAVLVTLAFIGQLAMPAVTFAQDAQRQREVIAKAVAEYQKTYDQIMALKPLELGSMADFTIRAIDKVKDTWSDIKDFFSRKSKEEKARRDAEEQYNSYKAQIDRANADIKKLKADAEKTMRLLKSGAVDEAGKTDTTKSYLHIIETGGALGVYQKALREAGQSLMDIGEKLSAASTVLATIAAVVTVIAVPFPALAWAPPILKGVSLALTVTSGVVKTAGNTLLTAAEKAITDDKNFMREAALEAALQAAETGSGFVTGRLGTVGGTIADATIGGVTSTIRDVNRSGATGSQAGGIAVRNFANSSMSAVTSAIFDGMVGQVSKDMTRDILSDQKIDATFKTDKSREDLQEAVEKTLNLVTDPAKSRVQDDLTIPEEEEKPQAKPQPGLSGSW